MPQMLISETLVFNMSQPSLRFETFSYTIHVSWFSRSLSILGERLSVMFLSSFRQSVVHFVAAYAVTAVTVTGTTPGRAST